MIEWNIQSRAHACQACRKPFANKELFHTLLFDHKHTYERLDICENCWTTQYSQATDRKGFISCWQSVYTVPPAAPPDPIQKETAESLLRKLIEQNDPGHAAARFILAVMLERKRLLKVKAQLLENQQRIFVYEHVGTGDLFQIPDPNLKLDKLEEVQREVGRLLEHGAHPTEPTASRTDAQKEITSATAETENKADGSQSAEEPNPVTPSSAI
ncbi:MAG: hypothetical protein HYY23_17520 [Verrucomicrobia bacterium]|nr:hypothetical protein [Verrucomicrobiota bacterium]